MRFVVVVVACSICLFFVCLFFVCLFVFLLFFVLSSILSLLHDHLYLSMSMWGE